MLLDEKHNSPCMSTYSTRTTSWREYLHIEELVGNDEKEIQSWPATFIYHQLIEWFGLDGALKDI